MSVFRRRTLEHFQDWCVTASTGAEAHLLSHLNAGLKARSSTGRGYGKRGIAITSFILLAVAMPLAAHAQSDDLRAEVEQLKKMVMQQQERINALEAERKHP